MYSYNIENAANEKAFIDVCAAIEKTIGGLCKVELLVDVDGTQIQQYVAENGTIRVYNDFEVDAVYIDSDVNLAEIFG